MRRGKTYLATVDLLNHPYLLIYCVFCLFTGRPKPKRDNVYALYSRTKMDVKLIMNNWGNPKPNYTWYHESIFVPLPRYRHNDTGTISVLNIANVQEKDFGEYWLEMRNSLGVYDSNYVLSPRGEEFCL